jgi:hypothetical protein
MRRGGRSYMGVRCCPPKARVTSHINVVNTRLTRVWLGNQIRLGHPTHYLRSPDTAVNTGVHKDLYTYGEAEIPNSILTAIHGENAVTRDKYIHIVWTRSEYNVHVLDCFHSSQSVRSHGKRMHSHDSAVTNERQWATSNPDIGLRLHDELRGDGRTGCEQARQRPVQEAIVQ